MRVPPPDVEQADRDVTVDYGLRIDGRRALGRTAGRRGRISVSLPFALLAGGISVEKRMGAIGPTG
jgi:hypothetical protein